VPVRIVLKDFLHNRSQKRAIKQHHNLTTAILPTAFHEEHYALYRIYQIVRHNDKVEGQEEKVEPDDAEQYRNFLCQSNVESVLVEFRENNQLKMVSVIDIVRDGISAVYTFYDTSNPKMSFGTYNVLWQIEWAKSLNVPYLYLGYWIKDSQKMAYKQNFKPLEKFANDDWA
jgi:arginine-tRNA-protein transferase